MRISSPAFRDGEFIPRQYSRNGEDKSPPLRIEGVPPDARSLVLILEDPDAPGNVFTHWLVFDMDPKTVNLNEDHAPEDPARQGTTDWGEAHYGGPQPPSGEHRYFFRLFALDCRLDLPRGSTRDRVEERMDDHVLGTATLMGRYAAQAEMAAAS